MEIEQSEVMILTPDGRMPAFVYTSTKPDYKPAVLLLMEAFGLTPYIGDVAIEIAKEGYVVLTPDLYYRELPNNKFGYDEVEKAMEMMYRLDFGKPMEEDLQAALAYLKSRPDLNPDRVGVTGFCLGGGLSFFTACKLSGEIAAAASFYGMVLDEWIDEITNKYILMQVTVFFATNELTITIWRRKTLFNISLSYCW
jgi:carboxymethylenebutenolidase